MEAFVVHIFGFILPLLFGNISHLVVIKNDLFLLMQSPSHLSYLERVRPIEVLL